MFGSLTIRSKKRLGKKRYGVQQSQIYSNSNPVDWQMPSIPNCPVDNIEKRQTAAALFGEEAIRSLLEIRWRSFFSIIFKREKPGAGFRRTAAGRIVRFRLLLPAWRNRIRLLFELLVVDNGSLRVSLLSMAMTCFLSISCKTSTRRKAGEHRNKNPNGVESSAIFRNAMAPCENDAYRRGAQPLRIHAKIP